MPCTQAETKTSSAGWTALVFVDQLSTGPPTRLKKNDFEGGRWINGEYYYENQRKGQTQTEDDRILGVFQDGSSDDEEDGPGGRRKKNKKGGGGGGRSQGPGKDHSKPVSFVGGNGRGGSGSGAKVYATLTTGMCDENVLLYTNLES